MVSKGTGTDFERRERLLHECVDSAESDDVSGAVEGFRASRTTAETLEGKHAPNISSLNGDGIRVSRGRDIPVAWSSGMDCSKELHALPVDPNGV